MRYIKVLFNKFLGLIEGEVNMKEGDIVRVATDRGGHLYKGCLVQIVRILSPVNEKPILVEPVEGVMGAWFNKKDLEVIEQ